MRQKVAQYYITLGFVIYARYDMVSVLSLCSESRGTCGVVKTVISLSHGYVCHTYNLTLCNSRHNYTRKCTNRSLIV